MARVCGGDPLVDWMIESMSWCLILPILVVLTFFWGLSGTLVLGGFCKGQFAFGGAKTAFWCVPMGAGGQLRAVRRGQKYQSSWSETVDKTPQVSQEWQGGV